MLVIVAPDPSTRLVALLAGAWAALAACASFGAIAFAAPVSTGPGAGARIGFLAVDPVHLLLAGAACAAVVAVGWNHSGRRVAVAVSPLLLVFLPWLPFPVPVAFFAWTGALSSLVWIAVATGLAAIVLRDRTVFRGTTARRHLVAAGVFGALIFSIAAWRASPALPSGDEPHYLVITQSLLRDGDLQIENNYRRGDYRTYFSGDLPPHVGMRGRNGADYSIHAPGLPVLVLPAFAAGGYRGVVIFLILLSAAGCSLAWWLAWRATGSHSAAWFGWAAVTTCAPFLLESFTIFPDGPGAVGVLTGFWALQRAGRDEDGGSWTRWFWHGAALAALPWMHTRFAVIAGTLGGLILVRLARTRNPIGNGIAFLLAPAVSALGWLFFFTILYGTPDPSAPYGSVAQNVLAFLPNGAGGLLFDQGFGVIATAPVLAIALAGFTRTRRLGLEWIIVALPYGLIVSTYAMWWAGVSGPSRFLVPLLLPLAVPAGCAWHAAASRGTRAVMIAALIVSAWIAAVAAGGGGGRLGYHTRNETGRTAAPWLEWANDVVDLPAAFPAFVPQPVQPDPGGMVSRRNAARGGLLDTVPWLLCLGGAAAFIKWAAERRHASIESAIAGTTFTGALAVMLALSIVWRMHAAEPVTAVRAQMQALRRLARGDAAVVNLSARRRVPADQAWSMRIELPVRRGGRQAARVNRPLAVFPQVPAGEYFLSVRRQTRGDGWVMVGVGNDQFAIVTQPIGAFDAEVRIVLPIEVRGLIVRGDEGARDQVEAVVLRPVASTGERLSNGVARRAVRYDRQVVYFLDDYAFPEPGGFWIAGERRGSVVIRPDEGRSVLSLRTGAVASAVTVESGQWRQDIMLNAGEERRIDLPIDTSHGAALVRIRSASGFRPSAFDPSNRDSRFLGVYIRPLDP